MLVIPQEEQAKGVKAIKLNAITKYIQGNVVKKQTKQRFYFSHTTGDKYIMFIVFIDICHPTKLSN